LFYNSFKLQNIYRHLYWCPYLRILASNIEFSKEYCWKWKFCRYWI